MSQEQDLSTLIVATEDMIMLQNLSEETLLENMKERYESNLIYVRGS
jgi:myosin heavy subunit